MSPNPLMCLAISQALSAVKKSGQLNSLRVVLSDLPGTPRQVSDASWSLILNTLNKPTISSVDLFKAGFPEKPFKGMHCVFVNSPLEDFVLDDSSSADWLVLGSPPEKNTLRIAHQIGLSIWVNNEKFNDKDISDYCDTLVRPIFSNDLWSQWCWPFTDIFVEAMSDYLISESGGAPKKSSLPSKFKNLKTPVLTSAAAAVGGVSVLLLMTSAILKKWDES